MALMAQLSEGEEDDEVWLAYYICYATFFMAETIVTQGLLTNLLDPSMLGTATNVIAMIKLPFLLFCLHPMTLGAKLFAKM
jgi:hypothetical protein